MKRLIMAAALTCALAPAFAEGEGGTAACKADFEKYCKDVKPGDGRQVKCMMDNKASVSAPCRAVLDKKQQEDQKRAQGGGASAACKADFEKYCKTVQPGEGRIMKCMTDNKANVSAPCRAALDKKA